MRRLSIQHANTMKEAEPTEQCSVKLVFPVRGSDKNNVIGQPVKFLHQSNRHAAHLCYIVSAAALHTDSIDFVEAQHTGTASGIVKDQTNVLLCLAKSRADKTGKFEIYERQVCFVGNVSCQFGFTSSGAKNWYSERPFL